MEHLFLDWILDSLIVDISPIFPDMKHLGLPR